MGFIDLTLINTYSSLLSGLLMFGIGIFVFLRNPKRKLTFVFLLLTFATANWLLSSFMMYKSKTDIETIFWDRMVYAGVVFIPVFMYHFGLIFTNSEMRNKKKLYLGYFFSFLFFVLSRTDYFVADLYRYNWGVHTQAKIFHHLFLAFYFLYIYLFLFEIYNYFKITKEKKEKIEIQQVKYLFAAFIFLNIGAYAFLPAYGININPIGAYLAEIIAVLILAFAITKYRLFKIKIILTEFLVGVFGITLLILPFFSSGITQIISILLFILFIAIGFFLIKYTYQEVNQKEILEEKVEERTKELQTTYEEMKKEKERLERLYKATVGRELRMIELKGIIKKKDEEIEKFKKTNF